MRCLLCACNKEDASLSDLLDGTDPICQTCRRKWERKDLYFKLEGIPCYAPYVYNDAFSECLLQFKECGDEALKDVFLYEIRKQFRRKYRGYTILLMPSSTQKREERGFSHLEEIFSCTKMPMLDVLAKAENISQKQKTFQERMEMKQKIQLKTDMKLPDRILLVDDTITSGATMLGALACIKDKCRKVRIFSVSANQRWYEGNE